MPKRPVFDIEMDGIGRKSRVWMNGEELFGLMDISVKQELDHPPMVTLTFAAGGVSSRNSVKEAQE